MMTVITLHKLWQVTNENKRSRLTGAYIKYISKEINHDNIQQSQFWYIIEAVHGESEIEIYADGYTNNICNIIITVLYERA